MFRKISCDDGFTLIEILIALTIFSVGLLAIAGLQISAIRHNSGSNLRTSSTALAQGVMEQILSMSNDELRFKSSSAGPYTDKIDIDPNISVIANTVKLPGAGSYTATWTVVVDTPVTGLSRIDVNVLEASGRLTTLTGYKRYNL